MYELAASHTRHSDPCSIPSDGEVGSARVIDLAVWVLAATLSIADGYRRGGSTVGHSKWSVHYQDTTDTAAAYQRSHCKHQEATSHMAPVWGHSPGWAGHQASL